MTPIFPNHDKTMQIIHNQHIGEGMELESYILAFGLEDNFQDPKTMIPQCIAAQSLWTISWSIGPIECETCGSTFEQAMSYALEIDAGIND